MPFINIKAYPKDEATKQELADRINEVLLEVWGCPQRAVTISIEDVAPEEWPEKVVKAQIEPMSEHLMIRSGEKLY